MKREDPLVSVAMITYGHEKMIRQSVESVLNQQCNFNVELIIADDCSPDNTPGIVLDIIQSNRNGSWIKYTRHEKNKGIQANFAWSMEQGRGKYIALLEGDDYWTDPLKLQKQIDFLENNQEFTMACNSSSEINEDGMEYKIARRNDDVIDLATVLKEGWFIRTASIVFRRDIIEDGFPDFFYNSYSTDYILQVMILKSGMCKYFPEVMSAYRHHQGGVSQANQKLQVERWISKIQLLETLNNYTEKKYLQEIKYHQKIIKRTISYYLFRYPALVKDLKFEVYLKQAKLWLFVEEVINRSQKRIQNLKRE